MKIFVCGADKSGKTTLTTKLASDLGFKRVHFTCPKPVLKDDDHILIKDIPVFNQIVNYMNSHANEDMIYDRFIYSDIVYGPIYRKPDTIMFRDLEQTYSEMLMQSYGMIGIYAESSDVKTSLTMLDKEGEGILDESLYTNVRIKYRQLVSHFVHIVPTFRYDWTTTPYEDVIKFIKGEERRLASNGFYQLLSESGMLLAGYLGPIFRMPEYIFTVPDISYDSYVKAMIDHPEMMNNPNIALTVDRPMLDRIISNVIEKN